MSRRARAVYNERTKKLVAEAVKSVTMHHTYLQSKLDYYKQYLENVRKGQAQAAAGGKGAATAAAAAKTPAKKPEEKVI
jgi:hypothetical protein